MAQNLHILNPKRREVCHEQINYVTESRWWLPRWSTRDSSLVVRSADGSAVQRSARRSRRLVGGRHRTDVRPVFPYRSAPLARSHRAHRAGRDPASAPQLLRTLQDASRRLRDEDQKRCLAFPQVRGHAFPLASNACSRFGARSHSGPKMGVSPAEHGASDYDQCDRIQCRHQRVRVRNALAVAGNEDDRRWHER